MCLSVCSFQFARHGQKNVCEKLWLKWIIYIYILYTWKCIFIVALFACSALNNIFGIGTGSFFFLFRTKNKCVTWLHVANTSKYFISVKYIKSFINKYANSPLHAISILEFSMICELESYAFFFVAAVTTRREKKNEKHWKKEYIAIGSYFYSMRWFFEIFFNRLDYGKELRGSRSGGDKAEQLAERREKRGNPIKTDMHGL